MYFVLINIYGTLLYLITRFKMLQRFLKMLKMHKDFKAKKVLGTQGYFAE